MPLNAWSAFYCRQKLRNYEVKEWESYLDQGQKGRNVQTDKTGKKYKNGLKEARGRTHQYSPPWFKGRDKSFYGLCDYDTVW